MKDVQPVKFVCSYGHFADGFGEGVGTVVVNAKYGIEYAF